MNDKQIPGTFHYFDKRTNEEDSPVDVPYPVHERCQHMEEIYEEFFDTNSLTIAKVRKGFVYFSQVQRKKEIRRA